MNKFVVKIIFYGLIIGMAFAAGVFYHKTTGSIKNVLPYNSPIVANTNANANQNINAAKSIVVPPAKTPEVNKPIVPPVNTPPPVIPVVPVLQPPPPAPPSPVVPSCIITIDGQRYDVQSLRDTHTGGDIFQCGTDMSEVFYDRHGNNLRMIQRYLVQ